MSQLPIESVLPELFGALDTHSQMILKAAPGAGKSTYLPLQLLRKAKVNGKIIMMEPRRLAARNIAHYLARQLDESVGQTVGFRVRGESQVSHHTRLEIVTEGVMTRMIQSDPELNGVGLVVFDEFHERSLHADTALAFCLEVQQALRDDLKILVMSATLDQAALQTLLPDAAYVQSQGRGFPIDYHYAPLLANQNVIARLGQLIPSWLAKESGSMLVFLPGVREIQQLANQLSELDLSAQGIDICPLYGQLDHGTQQKAIAPATAGRRKVVLATNIAETSLTIEGIRLVMDSGLERVAKFDPKTGITRLEKTMIAQSSAEQRAGRAGRVQAGVCVRLYSEESLKRQPQQAIPEILRSDLSHLQMELLQWGANEVSELAWLDTPPKPHLQQAQDLLIQLELVNFQGQLTPACQPLLRLGGEPRYMAMLMRAQALGNGYFQTACAVLALLEEPEKNSADLAYDWHRWQQGLHSKSKRLNRRSQQVAALCQERFEPSQVRAELLGSCAALAFPDRIAMARSNHHGQFLLANGHGAEIHEHHSLASLALTSECLLVAIDLMRPTHSMTSQIFRAVTLSRQEFQRIFAQQLEERDKIEWHQQKGQVVAERQQRFGALILSRQPIDKLDKGMKQKALLNYIQRQGLEVLPWNESSRNLLIRIRNAIEWLPEYDWPQCNDDILLANLEQWLEPYMVDIETVARLKTLNMHQILSSYLGWPLNQSIDEWLPTHYELPTGSKKAIRYQQGGDPILSVRMQEVFGESDSPSIAQGRKKLVLELLSPAQRPLQVTQDLAGFWQGSYKQVQKEMKGRYPKHIWPDDPANHVATAKTKRHFSK